MRAERIMLLWIFVIITKTEVSCHSPFLNS